MLNDILMHLHVVLFLTIILQSWHHFCADFLHAKIFIDNLPKTFFFHVQQTYDHLNSQLTITTDNLPYLLKINFSLLIEGLLFLGSSFTHPCHSVNLLCYLKTHVHGMILSSCTCWSISKCLWWSFFPIGPKSSGLFIVWCSLFIPQYS